jgi:hypothetical protein
MAERGTDAMSTNAEIEVESVATETVYGDAVYECPRCHYKRYTSPEPTPKHEHNGRIYTFVLSDDDDIDEDEPVAPKRRGPGRPRKSVE